jgi:hypothetical protein
MASFTDAKGEGWTITITVGQAKRIKQGPLAVDLLQPFDVDGEGIPLLTRIDTDLYFLVDLLFALCFDEAQVRSVDDLEFAGRLAGGPLRSARNALMEALQDFFQSLGRTPVVVAIDRQTEMLAEVLDRGAINLRNERIRELGRKTLDKMDRDVAREISRQMTALDTTPGDSSIASPENSASIPARSPSAS